MRKISIFEYLIERKKGNKANYQFEIIPIYNYDKSGINNNKTKLLLGLNILIIGCAIGLFGFLNSFQKNTDTNQVTIEEDALKSAKAIVEGAIKGDIETYEQYYGKDQYIKDFQSNYNFQTNPINYAQKLRKVFENLEITNYQFTKNENLEYNTITFMANPIKYNQSEVIEIAGYNTVQDKLDLVEFLGTNYQGKYTRSREKIEIKINISKYNQDQKTIIMGNRNAVNEHLISMLLVGD